MNQTVEEMLVNPSGVIEFEKAPDILENEGPDYIKSENTFRKLRKLINSDAPEDKAAGVAMLQRIIIGAAWWSQVNPRAKSFGLLRRSQEIEKDLRWGPDFESAIEDAKGFLKMLSEKMTKAEEAEALIKEIMDLCKEPTDYIFYMDQPTSDSGLHGWMRDFIDSVLEGEAQGPLKSLQMCRDALLNLSNKRSKPAPAPTNRKKAAARKRAALKRPAKDGENHEKKAGGDPDKNFVILGEPNPQGVPGVQPKRGAAVPGAGKDSKKRK